MLNYITIFKYLTKYRENKETERPKITTKTNLQRKTTKSNKQKIPEDKLRGSQTMKHQFRVQNSNICKVAADPKNWSPHLCCHELLLPRPALKPQKWEQPINSPRTMQKRTNFRRSSYTRWHRSFYWQSEKLPPTSILKLQNPEESSPMVATEPPNSDRCLYSTPNHHTAADQN